MRLVVGVSVLLLAGCLGDPSEVTWPAPVVTAIDGPGVLQPLRPDSYAFVHLEGHYERTYDDDVAGVCGFDAPPDIDPPGHAIHFHNELFDAESTQSIVAGHTWERGLCGVAVTHVWQSSDPQARLSGDVAGFGLVTVQFHSDGSVTVLGTNVPVGYRASFARSGQTADGHPFEAKVELANYGHWPQSGIMFSRSEP